MNNYRRDEHEEHEEHLPTNPGSPDPPLYGVRHRPQRHADSTSSGTARQRVRLQRVRRDRQRIGTTRNRRGWIWLRHAAERISLPLSNPLPIPACRKRRTTDRLRSGSGRIWHTPNATASPGRDHHHRPDSTTAGSTGDHDNRSCPRHYRSRHGDLS